MSDLEKAIERWDNSEIAQYVEGTLPIIVDAARRFASLTSPETIEKAAKQADEVLLDSGYPVHKKWSNREVRAVAEAVLRSVEEGET